VGNGVEQLALDEPLVIEANPFSGTQARWVANPVQTALAELIGQINCRRRLIVVAGKAGTGKTLLADMVVRVCSDMGLSTYRIDRGDLADVAHRATADVVVVDEAASITGPTVQALLSPDGKTATCVFLCLPIAVHRFSCPDTCVIDLHGLSHSDSRTYLIERAKSIGHPELFAPDALDLVIYRARGSFRLLRSIASLAFFDAAHEGETQIAARHVAYALESQMIENADENGISLRSPVSQGDRAGEGEADPLHDEQVLDGLERPTSHADGGATLHANVAHSNNADERLEDLLRRTDIRRPMGWAAKPIPDIGMQPYGLSARMREQSDGKVSSVKRIGQELRDTRERNLNSSAVIEQGRFEDLPSQAFTIGYVDSNARDLELDLGLQERSEAEIVTHDGIVKDRIDTEPNRKFPVLGIPIAGLLLAALIYSRDDIVSFAARTFAQATGEGLVQKSVDAPLANQQRQIAVREPLIPFPLDVVVAEPVSLREELLPSIPVIAVTGPVSLHADLTPAAVRQALIAAAGPLQGGQAQLPPGRRYGLRNRNSRITLRVHSPTVVAIRDARNRVFIDRKLAPGDTYRVPNLAGLWLTAIDASAVEIGLDGTSVGFAGAQRATVWDLSLNPQTIANHARGTNERPDRPQQPKRRANGQPETGVAEGELLK
jgi:cytoskeleton protein RodZ